MGHTWRMLTRHLGTRACKVEFLHRFPDALGRAPGPQMACSRGCGAILGGHVRLAGIERHDDVLCGNSGGLVESCTAIVEWSGPVPEPPPASASLSSGRPGRATVPGVAACA